LRRKYGQTIVIAAGFNYATEEMIVTLDIDLQNNPSDILMMLEKLYESYDLVRRW